MSEQFTSTDVEEVTVPVKLPEMEMTDNVIPFKAAKKTEVKIEQPSYYPLVYTDHVNGMLFTVHHDGSIEFGPAFTTNDEAAKQFWQAMGRQYAAVFRCSKCGAESVTP